MGNERRFEPGITAGSVFYDLDADPNGPGVTEISPDVFPADHPVLSLPCVQCGGDRQSLILLVPSETERRLLMAVPGQRRNVIFALCGACRGLSCGINAAISLILVEASFHAETN